MHYKTYSHYGSGDDLNYYNKKSEEYINNQYHEARAELEAMGQYDFVSNCGFIKIKNEESEFEDWNIYTLCAYANEHKSELQRVSSRYMLYDFGLKNLVLNEVLVHDKHRLIYIEELKVPEINSNNID